MLFPRPASAPAPTRHDLRVARTRRARRLKLLASGVSVVALVGLAGVAVASAPDGGTAAAAPQATLDPSSALLPRSDVAASRDLGTGRAPLAPASTVAATAATPLPASQQVHVVAPGWKVDDVVAAPATVGDLLRTEGVRPDSDDHLSVGPASAADARTGVAETVTVQRVSVAKRTTKTPDAHGTKTVEDPARLAALGTAVRTHGKDGVRTVVQRVTTVDGKVTQRTTLSSKTTAVDTVLVKGTKKSPAKASPAQAQAIARSMAASRGWGAGQFSCLVSLWNRESGWRVDAANPSSGAYGIPQSLPGSKMATVAGDWRTNATTQIAWGLDYIARSYGTPCGAWGHSQATGWY